MTSPSSKADRVDLITRVLRDSERPLTVKDIVAATRIVEISVRRYLVHLRIDGSIVRVPRVRSVHDSPRGRTPDRFRLADPGD